ncbi:MAG: tetratricopeptide repeat protein [Pseudomonadota bacterium]
MMFPYFRGAALFAAATLAMVPAGVRADAEIAAEQNRIRTEMVDNLKAYAVYKMGMYDEAFERWQALADKGNAQGILNLANMYQAGKGVPKDLAKALAWYKKGGDQGDPQCLFNVAEAYERGLGTAADAEKAAVYLRRAAEAGSSQGQLKLAQSLEAEGQTRDALYWYQRAADNGEAEARAFLAKASPAHDAALDRTSREAAQVRELLSLLDSATNERDLDLMMDPISPDAKIRVKLPAQSGYQTLDKAGLRELWQQTFNQSVRYRFARTRSEALRDGDDIRVVSTIREYLTTGNQTRQLQLDEDLRVDAGGLSPKITAMTLSITAVDPMSN